MLMNSVLVGYVDIWLLIGYSYPMGIWVVLVIIITFRLWAIGSYPW